MMQLAFATEPPSARQQEIIAAQAKADEASDLELLRRLEARRKARREKQSRNEDFPPDIERRERIIDLPEEDKKGLKPIGAKVTERLRFEKPHVYVEVIKRPQYVVAGQPAAGVRSAPPAAVDHRGLQVRFQRNRGGCGNEVRLPHADLSPAGLVWPVRLVPEPIDHQQLDQLRRGDARTLASAAVAPLVAATDSLGRRHTTSGPAAGRGRQEGTANARLEQRSGGRIVHASCNTHARREFVKAESNDPVLASQGISFYRQLYDVEERALEDVLRKLADAEQHHPADLALDSPCLLALLPNRWALTHPESVREGRVEEREDVLDAKRLRRTRARIEARAAQAAGS